MHSRWTLHLRGRWARGSIQACWALLAPFLRVLLTPIDRTFHYPLSAVHEFQEMYRLFYIINHVHLVSSEIDIIY